MMLNDATGYMASLMNLVVISGLQHAYIPMVSEYKKENIQKLMGDMIHAIARQYKLSEDVVLDDMIDIVETIIKISLR